jgi:RNA polymerase sigma-70 factor (ECF subfamily)
LALNFVSTPAQADEVLQDTWLGVINGIARFEQRSSVKTWIYRILMNVARTKGSRESRAVPFSAVGGEATDEPSFSTDRFHPPGTRNANHWSAPPEPWDEQPQSWLESEETVDRVRAAIEALPPNQRTVITLRDVEGWSADDVCNLLDLSQTNQRVLLHRARAKVRQALEDYFVSAES